MPDWKALIQGIVSIIITAVALYVLATWALFGEPWAIALLSAAFVGVLALWGIEIHLNQATKRKQKGETDGTSDA